MGIEGGARREPPTPSTQVWCDDNNSPRTGKDGGERGRRRGCFLTRTLVPTFGALTPCLARCLLLCKNNFSLNCQADCWGRRWLTHITGEVGFPGVLVDAGSIPESRKSPGGGNGNPLQCSCLEKPMDGAAWWTTVHGVAKSRTGLKDLALRLPEGK